MKKIFAILMAICMMVSAISVASITASAAETPAEGVVLRVSALKKDGVTLEKIQDYTKFDEGWEAAIDLAKSEEGMTEYSRVIVDFYGDWNADEDGVFGDSWRFASNWGDGFAWNTIYVPENVRITLNLNGHTIDRGLTEDIDDGEVIYIDENADVIIDNGTITGGYSNSGAGGIHVKGGAKVTLNNVHVDGNGVEDDDGAAIALCGDAALVMNGGSISNNVLRYVSDYFSVSSGVLYVHNGKAILNNVTISNNNADNFAATALIAYIDGTGSVTLNECTVKDNGIVNGEGYAASLFSSPYGEFIFEKTEFVNNGSPSDSGGWGKNALIEVDERVMINECKFINNNFSAIFRYATKGYPICEARNSVFANNGSEIVYVSDKTGPVNGFLHLVDCEFNNNNTGAFSEYTIRGDEDVQITLTDCDMGDSTYSGVENIQFFNCKNAPKQNGVGSIFGEGSLAVIISFVALIVSVAAIVVNLSSKKKAAYAAAKGAAEADE